jgi:hypothetical protein
LLESAREFKGSARGNYYRSVSHFIAYIINSPMEAFGVRLSADQITQLNNAMAAWKPHSAKASELGRQEGKQRNSKKDLIARNQWVELPVLRDATLARLRPFLDRLMAVGLEKPLDDDERNAFWNCLMFLLYIRRGGRPGLLAGS